MNLYHQKQILFVDKDDLKNNDAFDNKKLNDINNILEKIDLDRLSPKEALDILYAFKKNF